MKLFLIALFVIISITPLAYAHMVSGTSTSNTSFDDVMGMLMSNQQVTSVNQLDCSKLSNDDFEELGDAVMEKMIGNHDLHEQMDAMMGGEGSASLTQMHIAMGQNWLGCANSFQGMMGGYMMPTMMRMMGSYYPGYFTGYNTLLGFTLVGWILAFILGFILILSLMGYIRLNRKKR